MPWKVFREDGRYCVHKTDSDGRKGEKVKCHDSMDAADRQVKALYANVSEIDGSHNDFVDHARSDFSSQFGTAAERLWVVDVFDDYVFVREEGGQIFKVSMEATDDAITFAPSREWEKFKLSYVAEMDAEQLHDVMVIWELRGSYPDIPYFEDVDIEELTKGDDDPVFLTIPIGEVDSKSENGRYYDEKWINELERQVRENRPIDIMGHLKPEDLGTEFPPEAIFWVGVRRIGEMLWAKGYVPNGEARERIRRYKATNKKLATSIFAKAAGVWDKAVGAYRMAAETMKLAQIDIGPADRVGIPSLAAVPTITAEMAGKPPTTQEQITMADKVEVIRELTVEDADLLPKAVREAILAEAPAAPEIQQVTDLRQALGVDEKADLTAVVTEMKQKEEQRAREAITGRIRELVEDDEKGIKVKAVRPLVTELVSVRNPQSVEQAEQFYQEVVAGESVKELLQAHVVETMGPPQRTPVQSQNGKAHYFNVPEKETS